MAIETIIQDFITEDDLQKFEEKYLAHEKAKTLDVTIRFEYGWCLVRSKYREDIRKGVDILEGLCSSNVDQRDFLFFISIGHYKLADYNKSLKYVKRLLAIEPNNHQAKDLEKQIHTKLKSDGLLGMAMVGGAAVVAAGAVLIGFAFSKK